MFVQYLSSFSHTPDSNMKQNLYTYFYQNFEVYQRQSEETEFYLLLIQMKPCNQRNQHLQTAPIFIYHTDQNYNKAHCYAMQKRLYAYCALQNHQHTLLRHTNL